MCSCLVFLWQAEGDSELGQKMDKQHAAAQSKGPGQDSLKQAADAQKAVGVLFPVFSGHPCLQQSCKPAHFDLMANWFLVWFGDTASILSRPCASFGFQACFCKNLLPVG